MNIADYVILGIVAILLILAVRSVWKNRKKRSCCGECSGCCAQCEKQCHN